MGNKPRLTLASSSPQRRQLLAALGIAFEICPAHVQELSQGEPVTVALENARRKAQAVAGELVLGADTLVSLDEKVIGKPQCLSQARDYLTELSGREHTVVTGIVLACAGDLRSAVEVTRVQFRSLSSAAIDWYLASDEWRERAGGYAIQGRGAALVKAIEGDYSNVVGLPIARLLDLAPELLPELHQRS